jgi:7-cyano-7-deazaguanine synthase in queuosine biosynthesis|tara:strand:- start:1057 stop:1737 length:681 start_codon:yes stop_codon:yes gene_type:complete
MDLYLNKSWKRIGISLSGGADSALLAYLICKNVTITTDIHITSQIRCWRTRPWQEFYVDSVISWLKKEFNNNFFVHKNLVPPEMEEPNTTLIKDEYGKMKPGNRIILRSHNEFIANKYKLDAIYVGVNQNPDIDIPGQLDERNEGVLDPHFVHNGVDICHPFVYTKKDWIIRQYYKNSIEDLLDLTRSCEGEFEGLDYTTYTPGQDVPECGECFWCKERQWGIDNA